MRPVFSVVLATSALTFAATTPFDRRQSSGDDSSSFNVFAYGEGIGGLPMFSTGGSAFVGDYTRVNNTESAPVMITPSGDTLVGGPNTTDSGNNGSTPPTWSNLTFAIPNPSSSSHDVRLVSSSNDTSDLITSGFIFYGSFLFATDSTGAMGSLWYAVPSTDDGVYGLRWNSTNDDTDGKIPLTLKKTPPSSGV